MGRDPDRAWDAILALDFNAINATFAQAREAGLIPSRGESVYDFTADGQEVSAAVSGVAGPWRLIGADGSKAEVLVQLQSGILGYGARRIDLAGIEFKAKVPLAVITEKGGSGPIYTLALDFTDNDTQAVPSMKAIAEAAPRADLIGLKAVLTSYFFDALCDGVVALVRLDAALLASGRSWLRPEAVSCAAIAGKSGSAIAVLVSVAGQSAPGPSDPPCDVIDFGGGNSFVLSNEMATRHFVAPAFAAALGVTPAHLGLRPGRPFALELSGTAALGKAAISRATAQFEKGALATRVEGSAKFWGGGAIRFEITASYQAVVGGNEAVPKMIFRRTGREHRLELQVSAAARAVTFGQTGRHESRAEEIVAEVMEAVAPHRLGAPVSLDFTAGIDWPFGQELRLRSVALPRALQFGFAAG